MTAIVFTDEDVAAIERLVANGRQALFICRALDPEEKRRGPECRTDAIFTELHECVSMLTLLLRRAGR